ncbi:hypothetical protein BH23PLA1_BH23PLA1_17060 [soil metagenome]
MPNRPPHRSGGPPSRRPGGKPGSARPQGSRTSQGPKGRAQGPKRPRRPSGPPKAVEPGQERLNKVLAHAGLGSRRAVEELILQGRISINGQVVRELATHVDPEKARIDLDGERIKIERPVYFAVNKPKGYVSTNSDPAGRPRVIDLLPGVHERVFSVGRLDEESTGLILLTNDGELANRLTHPRYGVEKVYRALVAGDPGPQVLDQLMQGVWLSDGKARARHARFAGKQGEATVIELTLAEGKNREVRRMLAKLGHKIMTLTRIAVGPISLKGLPMGSWRHLTPQEVGLLQRVAAGELLPRPGRRPVPPKPGAARPARPATARPASGPIGVIPETSAPRRPRTGGLGDLIGGSGEPPRPRGRSPLSGGPGRPLPPRPGPPPRPSTPGARPATGGRPVRPAAGGRPARPSAGGRPAGPPRPPGPPIQGEDADEILVSPLETGPPLPPQRPSRPRPAGPGGPVRPRSQTPRRVIGGDRAETPSGPSGPGPKPRRISGPRRSAGPGKPFTGPPGRRKPKPLPPRRRPGARGDD